MINFLLAISMLGMAGCTLGLAILINDKGDHR